MNKVPEEGSSSLSPAQKAQPRPPALHQVITPVTFPGQFVVFPLNEPYLLAWTHHCSLNILGTSGIWGPLPRTLSLPSLPIQILPISLASSLVFILLVSSLIQISPPPQGLSSPTQKPRPHSSDSRIWPSTIRMITAMIMTIIKIESYKQQILCARRHMRISCSWSHSWGGWSQAVFLPHGFS